MRHLHRIALTALTIAGAGLASAREAAAGYVGTIGLSIGATTGNTNDVATATTFSFASPTVYNQPGTNQLSVGSTSGAYNVIPSGINASYVVANGPLDITGASLLSLNFTNGSLFTAPTASYGTFTETSVVFATLSSPAPNTERETVYILGEFTPTSLLGQPTTPVLTSILFTFDQVGGPGGSLVGQATLSTPAAVPEPGAIALLGLGGAFAVTMRRRMAAGA